LICFCLRENKRRRHAWIGWCAGVVQWGRSEVQ
jgi:hypothetical protein